MRAYAAEETLPERRIDLCRTPHKVAYRTRAEAKRAILTPGSRGRLHAYRCPCGRFHNGTAAAKPD